MARRRRFMQVPHGIEDDPRFADLTNAGWGVYYRLRHLADLAYPDPATLPRWCRDRDVRPLETVGVVERIGPERYRLAELDDARAEESARNAEAAAVRWGDQPHAHGYRPGARGPGSDPRSSQRDGTGQNGTGHDTRGSSDQRGSDGGMRPLRDLLPDLDPTIAGPADKPDGLAACAASLSARSSHARDRCAARAGSHGCQLRRRTAGSSSRPHASGSLRMRDPAGFRGGGCFRP